MKRFLASHPEYPRDRSGEVRAQDVTNLLKRPTYAGYVEGPNWGVALRKGPPCAAHQLSDLQSHPRPSARQSQGTGAQEPERGLSVARRRGLRSLRHAADGLLDDGHVLTLSVLPLPQAGLRNYGKSIRRATIEGEFEKLLHQLRPAPALLRVARAMFENLWNHRLATAETRKSGLETELAKVERDVEQFLDRIAQAELASVITAYENRIRQLEERQVEISERITNCGQPLRSFDEALRTSLDFLTNPGNLWASERPEHKQAVLKLAFADRLAYVRNEGFRTPDLFQGIGRDRKLQKQIGAPGEIRTPDLLVRSQTLYPTELRARRHESCGPRGGGEPWHRSLG